MLLDFTKLFPTSCVEKGITDFKVNLSDIRFIRRYRQKGNETEEESLEDQVQIKDELHCFSPVDDGVLKIASILHAQNLLKESQNNIRPNQLGVEIASKYLRLYKMKYGC